MTVNIIKFGDLPNNPNDPNGLTIREANAQIQHKYPIGTLVQVKFDTWFGDGACMKVEARLWVLEHTRDCDGTPLYTLCEKSWQEMEDSRNELIKSHGYAIKPTAQIFKENPYNWFITRGHGEDHLTPIEVTPRLKQGYDALEW